jgi:hypothetical protein
LLDVTLTLIGNDRETLDGVQQYFLRAGARVRTTAWLESAHSYVASSDAVILFADHYSPEFALRTALELCVGTLIIVTAEVGFFTPSRTAQSVAPRVVVLRSPVWGWMLLEAVRSGTRGNAGES